MPLKPAPRETCSQAEFATLVLITRFSLQLSAIHQCVQDVAQSVHRSCSSLVTYSHGKSMIVVCGLTGSAVYNSRHHVITTSRCMRDKHSLVRNRNSDFAFCQPLDRLLKRSSKDSGLGLLVCTPKDAMDGPILHQRNVGCNLQDTV